MRAEFTSLDKLSRGISYVQTALARVSGLLLMLGLVTASANFFMQDRLFGMFPILQDAWAVDQALAVDANLVLVFHLFFSAVKDKDWLKGAVYGLAGALLLFVATIIMNTESVRQALNITLKAAELQVNVSVLFLTWTRSIVVVLLVAMSSLDGVNLLAPEKPKPAVIPETKQPVKLKGRKGQQKFDEYIATHPQATNAEVERDLGMKLVMIRRYRKATNGHPLSVHTPAS